MSWLIRRNLRPLPPEDGTVVLRRAVLRVKLGEPWASELQRVREALPETLHDQGPTPNGSRGLWAVVASAQSTSSSAS